MLSQSVPLIVHNGRINISESGKWSDSCIDAPQERAVGELVITGIARVGFSAIIEFAQRKLLTPNANLYQLLDRNADQGLMNELVCGKKNRRLLIRALLNLETWLVPVAA